MDSGQLFNLFTLFSIAISLVVVEVDFNLY